MTKSMKNLLLGGNQIISTERDVAFCNHTGNVVVRDEAFWLALSLHGRSKGERHNRNDADRVAGFPFAIYFPTRSINRNNTKVA